MKNSTELPEEAFHAFTILLPRLITLSERACGLEPIELYVLWHMKHFGKPVNDGQTVFLRHKLTELLTRQFHLSANNVSIVIGNLHEKKLVETGPRLRREQLKTLYDFDGGRTAVVMLCPEGLAKIDQFKSEVNQLLSSLVKQLPPLLRKPFRGMLPILGRIARWMLDRSGQTQQ